MEELALSRLGQAVKMKSVPKGGVMIMEGNAHDRCVKVLPYSQDPGEDKPLYAISKDRAFVK
jgi:hypothetical protein